MATVSLLLRSVSKQNYADGFVCRMGSTRGLQERTILALGKHGHARSVYKWHGSLGRRCGVLSNYFDLLLCNACVTFYVNVFIHSLFRFFVLLVILKVQVQLYRPIKYWLYVVCVNLRVLLGDRSFVTAGPRIWHSLRTELCLGDSYTCVLKDF